MSTVSMTVNPRITYGIGVPRAAVLRFPQGNMFGAAEKPDQQRTILRAALDVLVQAQEPRTMLQLPYRWRRFRG